MGGKKNRTKTKWRKVPLGDLVDDAPSGDTSRKSHDSTDDGGSETGSFSPDDLHHDTSAEGSFPEIQFFGSQLPGFETPIAYIGNDGHCYYQTTELQNQQQQDRVPETNENRVSGCYVNGLWIPESELHKHVPGFPPPDLVADLPHLPPNAVYHHVPWVRVRPLINPTEHAGAPVFPQQTNFVPSDSHYYLYFTRRPTGGIHHQPKCWRVPRRNGSPYWCAHHGYHPGGEPQTVDPQTLVDQDQEDQEMEEETRQPTPYAYPGYAFGPPVLDTQVRQELAVPPSSLPVQDPLKIKRKKKRRKMKPDTNPNYGPSSTQNDYDQQNSSEWNGYGGTTPEDGESSNPFPEMDEETKYIEQFVQQFVHSTVVEAQETLGHMLNGFNGPDLTEECSLSLMSTESLSDLSHCEPTAVETFVLQILDEILQGAAENLVKIRRDARKGEENLEGHNGECGLADRFSEELLAKIFLEAKQDAVTTPDKSHRVINPEFKNNFLQVENVSKNKATVAPGSELFQDLFAAQRNDFENIVLLEESEFVERLVSNIVSSAVTEWVALRQGECFDHEVGKPSITEPSDEYIHVPEPIANENLLSSMEGDMIDFSSNFNSPNHGNPETTIESSTENFSSSSYRGSSDRNLEFQLARPTDSLSTDISILDQDLEDRYMSDPSSNWLAHTDALIKETEFELNRLQSKVLQTDRSIYKLAYDENVTDHSDTDEPEPRVPNVTDRYVRDRSEIIVHEMDTGSEAGSEDVELIPHRYDSPSALEKHLYVNKLSLATELLRTKETIPYDEEFKMIVGPQMANAEMDGRDNLGFEGDSSVHVSESNRKSNVSTVDSGVQSDESGDEGALEAKEMKVLAVPTTEDTEERDTSNEVSSSNGGYRRFGARTFGILKGGPFPCWCCNVM